MSDKKKDLVIVGLGSSAGGLEALTLFLSNLPPDSDNIAYVVVQHLSPTHKSMMRDLLARETRFDVLEIQSGLIPKANTIYITPPDRDVILKHGLFHLEKPLERWIGPKPSIDKFFISLAQEQEERAVGVILSGTGTDGSQGVRAIRAEGGIAIAQDPKQAKYDGMPASAIHTKSVDYILKAEEIAQEIIHLLKYPNSLRVEKALEDEFNSIFLIIRDRFNIDFSQYKKSTIIRRIERRMAAIKATTLGNYIAYIKDNMDEVELLYKDMLIGVTSFFRDTDAFNALADHLKTYIKENATDEQFRVWISACSTGEEAYSVAIIIDEIMGTTSKHIKIFATDIDEDAIAKARAGIFPELAVSTLSPERLKRYFTQKGNEFEVKPQLKERVIFSRHDITMDPPFVNVDLVTCRNMLIYFETELQKKIFTTFAYSLKLHGLLFLGKSESVGIHTDLFSTLDTKAKIFQTRTTAESKKLLYPQMLNPGKYIKPTIAIKTTKKNGGIEEAIRNTLFEYYEAKCVVIDNDFNLHYVKGNMNDMLKFPSGEMHNNILKMLPEKISLEVRALVYKANKNENITFPAIVEKVLADEVIQVKLTPLESYAGNYLYYLLCFEVKALKEDILMQKPVQSESAYTIQLEQELQATREHLQTVVEELETSNEELQSSNEELQASNEELQASNEELETTNEELQSTNEELQTAYAEIRALYEKQNLQKDYLEHKTEELSGLKEELDLQYNFLQNVLDSENNIVIVSNGKNIVSVNEKFYKFFPQYSTLDEFKTEHSCICDFFEKNSGDGYIYDKKDGANWIDLVLLSNRDDLKVEILKENVSYTFHIAASALHGEESLYVVTLTDISIMVAAKDKIKQELKNEIEKKVSSSRIMYQFNTIFGNDLIVRQIGEEIKRPLNKIYQDYASMLEVAQIKEDEKYKYKNSFLGLKDEILEQIDFLKMNFGILKRDTFNLYDAFKKISLLLASSQTSDVRIEVFGDQKVSIDDKDGQASLVVMLLVMLLIRISRASGMKDISLSIIIEENSGVIVIHINNQDKSICQYILQLESNKEISFDDKQLVNDTYHIFNSLLKDIYHTQMLIGLDGCKIEIPKGYKGES